MGTMIKMFSIVGFIGAAIKFILYTIIAIIVAGCLVIGGLVIWMFYPTTNSSPSVKITQTHNEIRENLERSLLSAQIEKVNEERLYYQNQNRIIGETAKILDLVKMVGPSVADEIAVNAVIENKDGKRSVELRNQQPSLVAGMVKEVLKEKPDAQIIINSIKKLMELDNEVIDF